MGGRGEPVNNPAPASGWRIWQVLHVWNLGPQSTWVTAPHSGLAPALQKPLLRGAEDTWIRGGNGGGGSSPALQNLPAPSTLSPKPQACLGIRGTGSFFPPSRANVDSRQLTGDQRLSFRLTVPPGTGDRASSPLSPRAPSRRCQESTWARAGGRESGRPGLCLSL